MRKYPEGQDEQLQITWKLLTSINKPGKQSEHWKAIFDSLYIIFVKYFNAYNDSVYYISTPIFLVNNSVYNL